MVREQTKREMRRIEAKAKMMRWELVDACECVADLQASGINIDKAIAQTAQKYGLSISAVEHALLAIIAKNNAVECWGEERRMWWNDYYKNLELAEE